MQLARNSSPPLAASPSAGSTCSPDGTVGPPPSDCTYAAMSLMLALSTHSGSGLRGTWAAGLVAGIRPVLIWKSTEAAPTPISVGPIDVPSALSPWQLAQ